jgi:uncharacterized radical SAM superfamily Fe-S cluster-containing enzyme
VDAEAVERDGKVYLVKACKTCGPTETLISSDAERYMTKRSLDDAHTYDGCMLKCIGCGKKNTPSFIFIDITNRCNLNCPICINNTPSMGFLFEPPLDYFEKIFDHFAAFEYPPAIQLFGGEPTVRKDLFEIIKLARARKLTVRIVTNGIRLADEEYCRQIVETRATVLISYDGKNPETYRELRGDERMFEKKHVAISNLQKLGAKKVAFMTCVARGYNDHELGEIIDYCHELRGTVRGIYFLPLAVTWDVEESGLNPDRMNTEDLEMMLDDAMPGEKIEFLPAGIMGSFPVLLKRLRVKRLPFMGAHPNCESFYVLFSDGERYRPLAWYLKKSVPEMGRELFRFEKKLKSREAPAGTTASKGRDAWLTFLAWAGLARLAVTHFRIGRMIKGAGLVKLWHLLCIPFAMLTRARRKKIAQNHLTMHQTLQMIILPFEDNSVLETERLERCPNSFAYYDPEADKVDHVPTCAWGEHKNPVMHRITDYYSAKSNNGEAGK